MKKALICPNEPRQTGFRVAQVENEGFAVADPLYWLDCSDDVIADEFWFDPADGLIKPVPIQMPAPVVPIGGAPNVIA